MSEKIQLPAEFVIAEIAQQRNAAQDEVAHLRAANNVLQQRIDALEKQLPTAAADAKA